MLRPALSFVFERPALRSSVVNAVSLNFSCLLLSAHFRLIISFWKGSSLLSSLSLSISPFASLSNSFHKALPPYTLQDIILEIHEGVQDKHKSWLSTSTVPPPSCCCLLRSCYSPAVASKGAVVPTGNRRRGAGTGRRGVEEGGRPAAAVIVVFVALQAPQMYRNAVSAPAVVRNLTGN